MEAAIHCHPDLKITLQQPAGTREPKGSLRCLQGSNRRLWCYQASHCPAARSPDTGGKAVTLKADECSQRQPSGPGGCHPFQGVWEYSRRTQHAYECHLPPPTAALPPALLGSGSPCLLPPVSSFLPPHLCQGPGKSSPRIPTGSTPEGEAGDWSSSSDISAWKVPPTPRLH